MLAQGGPIMSSVQIRQAIEKVSKVFTENPEKARVKNPPATAALVDGLKFQVTGPGGESIQTDMPAAVGGGATAPTPSWYMRAALASCNASCIAMQAAKRGVELAKLEVTVSSESDNRGMLGLDESVSAGLQAMRVHVRISATGTPARQLDELVRWACSHSPVGCADTHAAQVEVQVD
jgi:uncharacterized OsmC-like protein